MKLEYNILICDDNIYYIERLKEALGDLDIRGSKYRINLDIGTTSSESLSYIKNKIYDIIILDVCIKSENKNAQYIHDVIRSSLTSEYYGPELYEQILIDNPTAKVFALSNLSIKQLRTIFNYADIEYFNKINSKVPQIVQCIKNYFDTGKGRIFNNAFIVYGHNQVMRNSVENYIKSIGLNSIDLFEQSSGGIQSVFDALSDCANTAECAIVLLSADDITLNTENLEMYYRARQNVIFEMGLFAGYLGKNKVIVLYQRHTKFEFPTDIKGVFYIEYNETDEWKNKLKGYLKKIGFMI